MNFPTQMDQLIHDFQGARLVDARNHRLAALARAARRAEPSTPRRPQRRRSDAADLLLQLGAEVERLSASTLVPVADRALAELLVSASAALAAPARFVGLAPVERGTDAVVAGRWLARLAERTAGAEVHLDEAATTELSRIVVGLASLSDRRVLTTTPVPVPTPAVVHSGGVASVRLRGAC